MKRIIDGEQMVIQVVGYSGIPFVITNDVNLKCEVTHVEDTKIGNAYAVKYYDVDFIVSKFNDDGTIKEFRYFAKISPSVFIAWHKGTSPKEAVRTFIIDAWLQSRVYKK
jgi:hypothetical protein